MHWPTRARGRRPTPGRRVLPRHAAATRPRRGDARRPGGAVLTSRPTASTRKASDGAATSASSQTRAAPARLQPRAERGRADGRSRSHWPGPADPAADAAALRRGRRRMPSPRPNPSGCPLCSRRRAPPVSRTRTSPSTPPPSTWGARRDAPDRAAPPQPHGWLEEAFFHLTEQSEQPARVGDTSLHGVPV
jgi:hypothetical protein